MACADSTCLGIELMFNTVTMAWQCIVKTPLQVGDGELSWISECDPLPSIVSSLLSPRSFYSLDSSLRLPLLHDSGRATRTVTADSCNAHSCVQLVPYTVTTRVNRSSLRVERFDAVRERPAAWSARQTPWRLPLRCAARYDGIKRIAIGHHPNRPEVRPCLIVDSFSVSSYF
jgi:hypothetical protein